MNDLTNKDHDDFDALVGHLLDDYKANLVTKEQVVGTLGHIAEALDAGNYDEVQTWLREGRKYARDHS